MTKHLKNNIKFLAGIIVGLLLAGTTVYAATILFQSNQVGYDNTDSGMTATDVQEAIDELYAEASNDCSNGYTKMNTSSNSYECRIIPSPVSFSTDSWDTIIGNVKLGNTSSYTVGDTKTVDMGALGTHTLRVANNSTPAACSTTGFSQTACGFVLEFADIITTHNMNDTNTNVGGWPATSMRTYLNSDIYNALPDSLKSAIIDTAVVSGHGSTSGETNFTSTDKLYLLSPMEVYGYNEYSVGDSARSLSRRLDNYANLAVEVECDFCVGANGYNWWLRTASSSNASYFEYVEGDGLYSSDNASRNFGVSPAFRIG